MSPGLSSRARPALGTRACASPRSRCDAAGADARRCVNCPMYGTRPVRGRRGRSLGHRALDRGNCPISGHSRDTTVLHHLTLSAASLFRAPLAATNVVTASEPSFVLRSCRCWCVLLSGQCFCPPRMPEHGENHEGRGTPRPLRALGLLPASAARAPLGWHRCSHLSARHHHRGPLARGLTGRVVTSTRDGSGDGDRAACEHASRERTWPYPTTTDYAGATPNFSEHQERMNAAACRGSHAAG